jgi:hypothetical protein
MLTKEMINHTPTHFEIADRLHQIWKDKCYKNDVMPQIINLSTTSDFITHSIKYGPYYIWRINNKIIGMGGFSRKKHNEISIELLPHFYDLGYEIQILNLLTEEAKEIGISFLNSFIFPDDNYDQTILTKAGFFNNGLKYFNWGPKVPMICYRKNITTDHLN